MTSCTYGLIVAPATHLTQALPVTVVPEGLVIATVWVMPPQSGSWTWHEREPPWALVDCVTVVALALVQLVGSPLDRVSMFEFESRSPLAPQTLATPPPPQV